MCKKCKGTGRVKTTISVTVPADTKDKDKITIPARNHNLREDITLTINVIEKKKGFFK